MTALECLLWCRAFSICPIDKQMILHRSALMDSKMPRADGVVANLTHTDVCNATLYLNASTFQRKIYFLLHYVYLTALFGRLYSQMWSDSKNKVGQTGTPLSIGSVCIKSTFGFYPCCSYFGAFTGNSIFFTSWCCQFVCVWDSNTLSITAVEHHATINTM